MTTLNEKIRGTIDGLREALPEDLNQLIETGAGQISALDIAERALGVGDKAPAFVITVIWTFVMSGTASMGNCNADHPPATAINKKATNTRNRFSSEKSISLANMLVLSEVVKCEVLPITVRSIHAAITLLPPAATLISSKTRRQ